MVGIEIFPAEKSCDQGCAICPLARKDNDIIAITIDTNVQETFSLLEKAFSDVGIRYDLHLSSSLHLAPQIRYPGLIDMIRTTTKNDVCLSGNAQQFVAELHAYIKNTGITPKKIGYSFVPKTPIITESELDTLAEISNRIADWYFKKPDTELEVTIRSNLIKLGVYNTILPEVLATDMNLIKKHVENFAKPAKFFAKIEEEFDFHVYWSIYRAEKNKRTLRVINRILANKKVDTKEAYSQQLHYLFPQKTDMQDFAIAPKGVMLMHASIAINNPILWMTHNDFRAALEAELRLGRFSSLDFIQRILKENKMLYDVFTENWARNGVIHNYLNEFPHIFESERFAIRALMEKQKADS